MYIVHTTTFRIAIKTEYFSNIWSKILSQNYLLKSIFFTSHNVVVLLASCYHSFHLKRIIFHTLPFPLTSIISIFFFLSSNCRFHQAITTIWREKYRYLGFRTQSVFAIFYAKFSLFGGPSLKQWISTKLIV